MAISSLVPMLATSGFSITSVFVGVSNLQILYKISVYNRQVTMPLSAADSAVFPTYLSVSMHDGMPNTITVFHRSTLYKGSVGDPLDISLLKIGDTYKDLDITEKPLAATMDISEDPC